MQVIFPILLLGLMASLSPATILVFILLLGTTRAQVNALAFLVGWSLSLIVVFTLSYTLGTSRATQEGSGRTGVDVLELLLGLALVAFAARQWLRRNEPRKEKKPEGMGGRFSRGLMDLTPRGAVMVGVLKQPWAITAAAAVVVVDHHANPPVTLIAFAAFTVVSTATVGAIYLYYARSPEQAQAGLTLLRIRVIEAGPPLLAFAALVGGIVLTVDGLSGLT